ncbi:tail assembly chaperone [Lactiplantibacillus plantarum]|uniref:tail assembly chaperone n=1 Tax=Lactiplantibacillus plantarum TaxID=1590 RepID=UPI0021822C2C|nr:tail assembly chaperone [Lactiplantibacillus plantarum]MCS8622426.1 hypothetical protein [Lactiplantibacillus plantarum]
MKINDKEVKFNFKAFFRANKILSTAPNADDGASQLWLQFVTDNEMAVPNAVQVLLSGISEDKVVDLMDKYEEDGQFEQLRADLQDELQKSGFFRRAATHWINLVDKYQTGKKAETEEEKMKQQVQKDTLDAMRKSLS